MRKLDNDAQQRLREYRVDNAAQIERLLGQLLAMLTALPKPSWRAQHARESLVAKPERDKTVAIFTTLPGLTE